MKKTCAGFLPIFLIFVPVLVFAERAEVVGGNEETAGGYRSKKEISVGAAITPYDLRQSLVQITHRPKFGALGLGFGNLNYVSRSRFYPGRVRAVDFILFGGYWSNEKKAEKFGWHLYLGIGSAFLYRQDSRIATKALSVTYKKLGLGLDFYPYPVRKNEPGRKRIASFGLDLSVRNDADNFFNPKNWDYFSARLVYQVWFSK